MWSFSGVRGPKGREQKFFKLLVKPLYKRFILFHSYYLEARKGREKMKRALQAKTCIYIAFHAARKRIHYKCTQNLQVIRKYLILHKTVFQFFSLFEVPHKIISYYFILSFWSYVMFCTNYDVVGTQILTTSVTGRKTHLTLLTSSERKTTNFTCQSHVPPLPRQKKKEKKTEQNHICYGSLRVSIPTAALSLQGLEALVVLQSPPKFCPRKTRVRFIWDLL